MNKEKILARIDGAYNAVDEDLQFGGHGFTKAQLKTIQIALEAIKEYVEHGGCVKESVADQPHRFEYWINTAGKAYCSKYQANKAIDRGESLCRFVRDDTRITEILKKIGE